MRVLSRAAVAASLLLLSACGVSSPSTEVPGTPTEESGAPTEAAGSVDGYEPSAACDRLVELRSADLASADQQAEQVSVSDLPFTLPATGSVYCVMSFSTPDTDHHLAFEVIADDTDGNGPFVFSSSPDLSVTSCATSTPVMCFAGAGDVYVSVSAISGVDGFPSQQLVSAYVMGG